MLVISVVGARPNFMKMAPVISALREGGIHSYLVHTGQHYDKNMSQVFFDELKLPVPDKFLGVGSGSHAEQTAKVLIEFEKICLDEKPDLVIVAGDVNSTLACALVASKLNIPVAHIESGLRSFDRAMPEEINRVLTDRISDLLFVTEESGMKHLKREGIQSNKIHFVGNTMIDSVIKSLPVTLGQEPWEKYKLTQNDYCLITMHRPSNVDSQENIGNIISMLNRMSERLQIIFPIHPRTQKALKNSTITLSNKIKLLDPLSYFDFLGIMSQAKVVVTDSGGIQEETTYLGVQCITVRKNTERPITIALGTNHLVGNNSDAVLETFNAILNGNIKNGNVPPKWDGKSGQRIAKIIKEYLSKR